MKKYYSLLKKYVKNKRLYVILNNGTISQAEIFTLKLKSLNNVTAVGQTTKGMLAYGNNYDQREKLASGRFEIYPTGVKGRGNLLQYEDYGIKPGIILQNDSNWIDQIVEIIRKK